MPPRDPRGNDRRGSTAWGENIGLDVAFDHVGQPSQAKPVKPYEPQATVAVVPGREYLAHMSDGTQTVIVPLNTVLVLDTPGFDGRRIVKVE